MPKSKMVELALTRDQALVLFDWLSREDEAERIKTDHPSEQDVLWAIEAQLEKFLLEPLQADYRGAVNAARDRITASKK